MSRELSPQSEQYLADAVARGLFPSAEAALEAAVKALREKTAEPIPAEHVELIERGIASLQAGRCRVFTDADWENLRQLARDTASNSQPSGL